MCLEKIGNSVIDCQIPPLEVMWINLAFSPFSPFKFGVFACQVGYLFIFWSCLNKRRDIVGGHLATIWIIRAQRLWFYMFVVHVCGSLFMWFLVHAVHVCGSCLWFMFVVLHVCGSCLWFMVHVVHVCGSCLWFMSVVLHVCGSCL